MQLHTLVYNHTVGDSFKYWAIVLLIGLVSSQKATWLIFWYFFLPSWLFPITFWSFICLEMGSSRICFITFLGTDVRLTSP